MMRRIILAWMGVMVLPAILLAGDEAESDSLQWLNQQVDPWELDAEDDIRIVQPGPLPVSRNKGDRYLRFVTDTAIGFEGLRAEGQQYSATEWSGEWTVSNSSPNPSTTMKEFDMDASSGMAFSLDLSVVEIFYRTMSFDWQWRATVLPPGGIPGDLLIRHRVDGEGDLSMWGLSRPVVEGRWDDLHLELSITLLRYSGSIDGNGGVGFSPTTLSVDEDVEGSGYGGSATVSYDLFGVLGLSVTYGWEKWIGDLEGVNTPLSYGVGFSF